MASLNDLLYDVKRIADHREKLTDSKITAIYQSLTKELNSFLAEEFIKYSDKDGRLFVSYLDTNNRKARFLQEIAARVDSIAPQIKDAIMFCAEETYNECYKGMAQAFQSTLEAKTGEVAEEVFENVFGDVAVNPSVLARAFNNPISQLTLPYVLQKHRAETIYQIQQELNIGLMQGDRYEKIARRISERIGVSESKAKNITRTETHRNVETGFMDCAENLSSKMEGSEYIYAATWHNVGDERVRPNVVRKTKHGWKHYISKNGADHVKMEGQTVKVGELFNLGNGVKAKCPSQSGVAAHDCNCRCFVEYNLMTAEEFAKASGKNESAVREKYGMVSEAMDAETRQMMNENGIVDMKLQETKEVERFIDSIEEAKKTMATGGCVDVPEKANARKYKLLLAEDNMAGVAVKPDGDITAVFKNNNSDKKGAVNDLIITARANGGTKMDCYGQFLVNSYEKCGYVPVARVPFNADYVSDPWLLKTKPDVYVMMKNSDDLATVIAKNGKRAYPLSTQEALDNLLTFTDYDEALKYRDLLLARQTAGKAIDEATKHYAYSVVKEPKITADLQRAVGKTNGKLSGLDFRLKTEGSYTRKVETEILDINKKLKKQGIKYTATQADAVENMRDVVRYTSISSKENLVKDFNDIVGGLEADGYKLVRVKNTFTPESTYKGINVIFENADGYNFELQFHTQQSFDLKNGKLHELYEKYRLPTTTPDVKKLLDAEMKELSDSIVFPDGVDSIKSFNNIVDIIDKIKKKIK